MPHATSSPPSIGGLHDDQVVALLRSGAHAALLAGYFGEQEYRELAQLAKLASTRANPQGPRVFILPGIMGTRLAAVSGQSVDLLWLHPHSLAQGDLVRLALPQGRALRPVGVMLPGYLKLKLSLEVAGFTPIFHPFDWRIDLERSAAALLQAIDACGAHPVMVVAHSLGGLVARAALAKDKRQRISRLVQLGTPNLGAFAPLQALRAVYPTVRKLAALDQVNTAEELARRVFHTFVGLYQLLPAQTPTQPLDFFDAASWPDDALRPDPDRLARARRTRMRLPAADERCAHIVGYGQETITRVVNSEDGFVYHYTRDGDGTVPISLADWTGARTWYACANHGAMTSEDRVIGATLDLLDTDTTRRLPTQRPSPNAAIIRSASDRELRTHATQKVTWDALSLESRRRILEPVYTEEFES